MQLDNSHLDGYRLTWSLLLISAWFESGEFTTIRFRNGLFKTIRLERGLVRPRSRGAHVPFLNSRLCIELIWTKAPLPQLLRRYA